jgi:uncharacterized protein (TIGR03066 family)
LTALFAQQRRIFSKRFENLICCMEDTFIERFVAFDLCSFQSPFERNRVNRKQLFLACLSLMFLSAVTVHAAGPSLTGKWLHKSENLRIEMEFKANGEFAVDGKAGDKTSTFAGTYKVTASELIITPSDSTAVTYALRLEDDQMTLVGGDFGEGKGLIFSKRTAAAAAPEMPEVKPPAKKLDAPQPDAKEVKKDETELPGGTWDLKGLESSFTIVKTKVEADKSKVVWLLERKDDGFVSFDAAFYDEDDVKIGTANVSLDPSLDQVHKGERTRATVVLLKDSEMKKVKRTMITKR